MDCLIHLATALCLIQPSQIVLKAETSVRASGDVTRWNAGHNYGGGHLGRVSLELPLLTARSFVLTTSYTHESLLDTSHDRGEERLSLGLQWRPFR